MPSCPSRVITRVSDGRSVSGTSQPRSSRGTRCSVPRGPHVRTIDPSARAAVTWAAASRRVRAHRASGAAPMSWACTASSQRSVSSALPRARDGPEQLRGGPGPP